MAGGVYVHFPYCRHHCAYCDFNVAMPRNIPQQAYTDAVVSEVSRRASLLDEPADSLYVGGGTPSLWALDQLARVVEAVRAAPGLTADAELTIEANPAEVAAGWLVGVRQLGFDRVSLGVQAVRDGLLQAADRRHDAAGAREAVSLLDSSELRTWSMDLMFGLPGQRAAGWVEDVAAVAATLKPPHLSVYALTVEPRTRLAWQVRRGDVELPGDDAQARMLLAARSVLRARGWAHYEVSSYARPGHRSRHNSKYWSMTPYLGIGAGAHGFAAGRRWWNVRRPSRYIEAALSPRGPTAGEEQPTAAVLAFEAIMTGLRDLERGVSERSLGRPRLGPLLHAEVRRGRLERVGDRIRVTLDGLRMMDDLLLGLVP